MNPMRIGILLILAAAAIFVPASAHSASSATTLTATVGTGDAFVITLNDANGRVTHLDPGDYTIVVHDRSAIHNFHLSGPGVDKSTSEEFVGDVTWNVTLVDGSYHYQCDPHASRMKGDFTVGTVVAPPPPVNLSATVGPKRTISLRDATGARVSSLVAGSYRITVRDRTKTDNFHLRGPATNKSTGIKSRTTVRWTLTLAPGSYSYRSDKHKSLRGSFRVTAS